MLLINFDLLFRQVKADLLASRVIVQGRYGQGHADLEDQPDPDQGQGQFGLADVDPDPLVSLE